jgi:hypothetical protein
MMPGEGLLLVVAALLAGQVGEDLKIVAGVRLERITARATGRGLSCPSWVAEARALAGSTVIPQTGSVVCPPAVGRVGASSLGEKLTG